jgi:vacuolar-type H+-ATPase subunit F/Vma7
MKGCVGRIKCAVLICGAEVEGSETFGQKTCASLADRLPVYVAVRQGASARRKLRDTEVEKWKSTVYSTDDHKKVIKLLGESLPESSVRPVTEFNIWEFVSQGTAKGLVSIVLVSNTDQAPGLYRNLALSVSNQAQFGFMNMPSPDFARAIGNKLPAVIAIPSPSSSDEAESKGVQIINYNPEILGPFSFAGLHQFVEGVYQAFAHTFPAPERPAGARSGAPRPPPDAPPPVDEGPIVTDSEESIQEAEELLREIQRDEDARAAQLKEEMRQEEERKATEADSKKKKKKKGKKSKRKASKSEL